MKQLRTMNEALDALYAYVPNTASMRANYTLDRMREFMAKIGNPQEACCTIHIAGTSGKTSTAYFTRRLFQNAGKVTGLTVSPHIVSVTERVQVNGRPLSDSAFLADLNRFLPLVEESGIPLTYFEVLIAFAYWVFAEHGVEYAVVETGLGGLLDATNVIQRPDKLCVITDIGFDHTEILGNAIEEIAFQKAGIIQSGNHVLLIEQGKEAMDVVRAEALKRHADLEVIAPATHAALSRSPAFQRRNMAMAAAVYGYVAERDGLAPLSEQSMYAASVDTPPGRMERYKVGDREVVLDGAHNPQKLLALRLALEESGVHSAAVLANFVRAPQRKIDESLMELRSLSAHLIVPEFSAVQDIGKESVAAKELAERARKLGFESVQVCSELPQAVTALLQCPEPNLLVTGSLYLVSQVRALLKGRA